MQQELTWLVGRDAGKLLNLTTSGVRRLEETGQLRAIRDSSGRRLYHVDDVQRLVRERAARRGRGQRH